MTGFVTMYVAIHELKNLKTNELNSLFLKRLFLGLGDDFFTRLGLGADIA